MISPILVIGGGLGGLCLAQGLKKAGIPFHVFERDGSLYSRPQGYRIRINSDGANALKANLSPELWTLFEQTCGELRLGQSRVNALDASSEVVGAIPGRNFSKFSNSTSPLGPYNADRTTFRRLLTIGLEDDISFGKELSRFESSSSSVTAHFRDGSTASGSFLVGADGLRSPVRTQHIPGHLILDVDARCIYGKTPITTELKERFPADAMRWITLIKGSTSSMLFLEPVMFATDPVITSKGMLPSVSDYVYWVFGARTATFKLSDDELLNLSGQQAADLSLKLTSQWDPKIRSLLELQTSDQTSALRIASVRPDMQPWTPSPRVTLLGDAIHPMSPSGGVGANTALQDAAHLCRMLSEARGRDVSVEEVEKYENFMREYAGEAVKGSARGGKTLFGQPDFDDCKPLKM